MHLKKHSISFFNKLFIVVTSFALYLQSTVVSSQPLPLNNDIKLGMSNALSGPAKNLGQDLKQGSLVYFNNLNENGGIHGKKIKLISLDDGYEPENTVGNTRKLIEDEQVLALFGYVGTPTTYAILPILNKSKIPYLMPFTGADFLRSPVVSNIYNLRASYYQEVQAQVNYLVKKLAFKNIAIVIQADEFGLSAQRDIIKVLKQYKMKPIISARFKRNSNDIEQALAKLKTKPIDAVIFVGTYQPFSHLINLAYQQGIRPLFTSLSFIGSQSAFSHLKYPSKVMISEVMPDPNLCEWQLCQNFLIDMDKAGIKKVNRIHLEGYLNAFVFAQVAKMCTAKLTQKCLLEKFETFSFNDQTLTINFSADNHQGLQQVYFSFSDVAKNHRE